MPPRDALPPPVTVSIVSHGQWSLVEPLLEQLDQWSSGTIAKVVLTVNIPESLALKNSWRFEIERVDNVRPRGFGANHNAAFSHCRTPWFLVLNPDIRFDRDILADLLTQAADDSGLLAPRITEPGKSGPEQHRAILTPLEILTRKRAFYAPPTAPAWIPGLFMLFRAKAYRSIGGFDERFFMYGEDFDICARLRLAGWGLQVAENVNAWHAAQRASHSRPRYLYWHVTSLMRLWLSQVFWQYRRMTRDASREGAK